MLSAIFGRPVPTGSGDLAQSAYGPFIDGLVEGVLAHREARAVVYRLQRLEREFKDTGVELDEIEVKRIEDELRHPRKRRRTNLAQFDTQIAELRPIFRQKATAVEQLKEQLTKARAEARSVADKVFSLEAQVTNDVFRPDVPLVLSLYTSPELFSLLRRAKAGSWLLEEYQEQEQTAEAEVRRSAIEVQYAAIRLADSANLHERQNRNFSDDLLKLMQELGRRMAAHDIVLKGRIESKARAYRRAIDQIILEQELFLDVATPVLVAAGRVAEDRLYTSRIGRDKDGERFVYQIAKDSPDQTLTLVQRKRYVVDYNEWVKALEKRQVALTRLHAQRDEEVQNFWRKIQLANNLEEDQLVAEEEVKEVEDLADALLCVLRDVCGTERSYEYFDQAEDRTETSDDTIDRQGHMANADKTTRWREALAHSHPAGTPRVSSTATGRSWTSVMVNDLRAYDYWSEYPEDAWLRGAYIRWRNRVTEDIRNGLDMIDVDSDSGSDTGCCWIC
ncbi:hypothetical protein LTR10_004510 [Elasticomyces elasticus]|nr:hypothetical protein LTR10_004510 [Elasticomyces elasticus]KAK4976829.1 hypothetical protein LTR42_002874 [Elasticomyces elasticus]